MSRCPAIRLLRLDGYAADWQPARASELRRVGGDSLHKILDGFGSSGITTVKRQATLGPTKRLGPVLRLLLPNRHLAVGLQQRQFSKLLRQGVSDDIHFGVVEIACCVVVVKGRTEGIARPV